MNLKNLRRNFERFCYQNRSKGIPNLMLFVTITTAVIYLFSIYSGNYVLYSLLRFDRQLILKGQVWRLFTYIFLNFNDSFVWMAISLLCYYSLGRAMENLWGTCRFNLFYFAGVILMDVFAMVSGCFYTNDPIMSYYVNLMVDVSYLNLSLFLAYATLYPDTHFMLFFIIPVRAWIFAVFYLGITAYQVIELSVPNFLFPINFFPLVALANYFLFFGSDIKNVFPLSWRANAGRLFRKKKHYAPQQPQRRTGTIPFPNAGSYEASTAKVKAPYHHKCTVCGRTDVSNPELEFRYCSKCNGYHCYCEDHIGNHTHIE